jgi:hypothetical protein
MAMKRKSKCQRIHSNYDTILTYYTADEMKVEAIMKFERVCITDQAGSLYRSYMRTVYV